MTKKYYLMKALMSMAIALFSGFTYIYLSKKNISDSDIGLLIFIFWLSSLIFEIPSGMLSDYIGRRAVYLFSIIMRVGGLALIAYQNTYTGIFAGFICTGIADAFSSGCLEAWIYDSVKTNEVDSISVNSSRLSTFLSATVGFAGVKIFEITSGDLVFTISMAILCLNGVLAFYFIRDKHNKKNSDNNIFSSLIEAKKVFIDNPNDQQVFRVSSISILAVLLSIIPGTYYQLLLNKFVDVKQLLMIASLLIPITALVGQSCYKKINLHKNIHLLDKIVLTSGLLIILSTLASNPYLTLFLFLSHVFLTVAVEIFVVSFINQKITNNRNTIMSVVFFTQSLLSSILLLAVSLLLKVFTVSIMEIMVTVFILVLFFIIRYKPKQVFFRCV